MLSVGACRLAALRGRMDPMMICVSCHTRNSDQSTFCLRCGADLEAALGDQLPGDSTDSMPVVVDSTAAGLVTRAANQLAEGHTAEALADCRRAIALEPGHVEAHALLGMAYEQQGELAAALEAYEAVLALDPDRAVERQKANILRLRVEGAVPPNVPLAHHPTVWETIWRRVTANPPLSGGIAAGLVVFLIGSIVLVNAQSEARARQDAEQLRAAGDQAFSEARYADATRLYAQAWEITPQDEYLRDRWNQAYQLSLQQAGQQQVAQLPDKYLGPSPNATNPFKPVPIGGQQPTPPPTTDLAVPPPAAPPSAYDRWSGKSLTPPPVTPPATTPTTTPTGRRDNPLSPITPVQPKTAKDPTPAPATDTAPPPRKGGEITIWVSDTQPAPAAAPTTSGPKAGSNADALRSQADQLARQGRRDEAIEGFQKAASAYDEAARSDPAASAVHSQAADSCRARIEVLKMSQ